MTSGTPALKSARLLDQVQKRARYLQYSSYNLIKLSLFDTFYYIYRRKSSCMRHPCYIVVTEVEALLTMVSTARKAPAAARS
jgi:hypothetical protein